MWKIALSFVVIAASATFYITSQTYQNTPKSMSERTWFDESGKLHVMGIILGESTLRDAEKAFLSRADAAIFLYPLPDKKDTKNKQFHAELEAYFPSIADHSKVILKLITTPEELEAIRQRGTPPRIYPNDVVRINLSNKDIIDVQRKVIRQFKLIPSVELDLSILTAQFGTPSATSDINATTTEYKFNTLGLTATINTDGKDKLEFSNFN